MISYTHLYTGTDGKSHFKDASISMKQSPITGRDTSELMPTTFALFMESTELQGYHVASRRQFLIFLDGEMDITVGDGTIHHFKAGDIMLADDTTGQGHISRVVGNNPVKAVFVVLAQK